MKNGKTKIDVATLETRMNFVEKAVEKIETNHLPHIQAALERLDDKFEAKTDALSTKITKIMTVGGLLLLAAEIAIGVAFKH